MPVFMNFRPTGRWAAFGRVVTLVLASAALSGCIVVPYQPFGYYHHWR